METKETSTTAASTPAKPYAVILTGGMQFTVSEGDIINVPELASEPKSKVTISDVLLSATDAGVKVGAPKLSGASVTASVVRHLRASKVIIFKKRKRKGYLKKQGHRQDLTQIKIESIKA